MIEVAKNNLGLVEKVGEVFFNSLRKEGTFLGRAVFLLSSILIISYIYTRATSRYRALGELTDKKEAVKLKKPKPFLEPSGDDNSKFLDIKLEILKEKEKGADLYNALKNTFSSIKKSENVKVLDLSDLELDKLDLQLVFKFFKNLEELDLSRAKISNEFLELIAKEGKSLKKLDLNYCTEDSSSIVSEEIFEGFGPLTDLELTSLSLEKVSFLSYNHLIQISCLATLEYLNLSGNEGLLKKYMEGKEVTYDLAFQEVCDLLKSLKKLQTLAITGWGITKDQSKLLDAISPNLRLKMYTKTS
jgi:hypothetical protein